MHNLLKKIHFCPDSDDVAFSMVQSWRGLQEVYRRTHTQSHTIALQQRLVGFFQFEEHLSIKTMISVQNVGLVQNVSSARITNLLAL
jgi:hypothetical protein